MFNRQNTDHRFTVWVCEVDVQLPISIVITDIPRISLYITLIQKFSFVFPHLRYQIHAPFIVTGHTQNAIDIGDSPWYSSQGNEPSWIPCQWHTQYTIVAIFWHVSIVARRKITTTWNVHVMCHTIHVYVVAELNSCSERPVNGNILFLPFILSTLMQWYPLNTQK